MKYKHNIARISILSAVVGMSLGVSHIATAQSQDSGYAPLGIHAGSFFLFPVLELGIGYDDNVFRLPDAEVQARQNEGTVQTKQSDTAVVGNASVTVNSDWNRHALNGIASVNLGKYSDFNSEDFGNYNVGMDGVLDVTRGTRLTGNIGYRDEQEDRNSLNSRERVNGEPVYGTEPTRYQNTYLGAGFEYSPARLQVKADLKYDGLNYDDVENIFGGTVDNSDRNRARTDAILRLGYEIMPQRRLYVEGNVYNIEYDQQFDNNGVERSSTGTEIRGGINFDLSNLLTGDIYLGYLEHDYDSPALEDISSNTYGAGLQWFPTRLTSVNLGIDRKAEETTEASASGYLSTIYEAGVKHELKRNILLGANLTYTNNDFTQNEANQKQNEDITQFKLDARYSISRLWYTTAEYRYEKRISDIEIQEYNNNIGLIKVGMNW